MDEINRAATAMTAQQKIKHTYFNITLNAILIKFCEYLRCIGGSI